MAKDEEIDFDNFDFDDMDDDFGLGESQSNKPTTAREAAVNSLKDGISGFTEDIAGDPLATAVELAEKSLPNSVRSEVMDVKDVATTLRDEVKQATMDVRRAGTTTLKSIGSMMPDNSGMKNLLEKVVNFIGPDDSYDQQQEQISKEQAQNLEIQTGIIEALGNLTPDARQEALRQQIELNRSKSHQELMATTVSNGQKLLDYTYNVTNNYYRKSLELQYKHYYTSREQLGLLKTSLETFKLQFENIIKNTALPEIVKIHSSEQLKENLAFRSREAITDVVYNELNPLKSFKEKATNKIRSVKDDFVEGFQTADEVADSASMLADMEEMGFTKSKIAGSFLGGGLKSFVGNKIGNALEDNKEFKKTAFNFKNAVNNPSGFISDQAKNVGDKSFFGSDFVSNLLYSTADMFKPDDPRTLATFKKEDPESAAIFNYRTQNSITTVIPNLLSKIYGEVKSIRTGDTNPEGNEIRWNEGKDKFESLADVANNVKSSIKKTVSDKMGYGLNKMMDKIDPKKELSKEESSQVLSSLTKYLQETKDTTPIGLVKGKNSFLNYLPEELRPKLNKNLGAMVKNAKEDHYEYSDLNYTLKSLAQSIPNLIKEATTLYKTGNKKVLEDLGIMVTDDVSNTSYVDRNGIFKFVNQNIEEHGADGFREDNLKTESMAKYTGNKTQAELDALRKKEYRKKSKPRRSIEEVLEESSIASEVKNKKNRDKYDFKKEFDTRADSVLKETKAVYEDSINNNVNKVKDKVNKTTSKIKDSDILKEANSVIEEGKKTFNKAKRKAKVYSKVGKKKVDNVLNSKVVTKSKEKLNKKVDDLKANETYKEAMEKIDSHLDTFSKEYLEEEAKLDKLFQDNNINVSVKEMRGRINKEGLTNLFNKTKEKIDSTFKTGKEKVNKVYEDNKDKSTKDIVNEAKEKGKGLADNLSEIISDATKGKISVKTSNHPLSGLDKLNHSDVSKVKHFGRTIEESKEKYEKYKDLDDKTENILREMYFKSEAYLLGKARSFGDYVKTFGYSPRQAENNISKNIIVDGLTQMSKEERIKKEQEFKKSLLDAIRLKKLSKEDDDALRFEFYNSPEYKAGAIKDYDKWLKDKGFRSHYSTPLISIKSILRKTRAFDRMVFNNLVAKPIKAIAKAPFKAAMGLGKAALNPVKTAKGLWNGTSTVGKLFKAVSTPALYAADGIASTVGLGFYGVKDNKYIAKAKDAIKYRGMSEEEIAYLKEQDTTVLDKGINKVRELNKGVIGGTVRGIGKGLKGAAGLGFKGVKGVGKLGWGTVKAINPLGLADKAPTKAEILKKYKDKKPNKTVIDGKVVDKQETKPKEPAYNDKDGSGRRDGSWLDKLDEMKAAKEKAKNNTSPKQESKPEEKKTSIFDMLKSAVGILGTIGGVAGSMLTGILAIKPLLSLISGGVSGVISAVTGGFGLLTKVPELLSGMLTKISNIPSAIGKFVSNSFSALKGIGTTVAETVTGAVGKAKEVVGKVVESGKSLVAKVTPDSIKAFYNKIKDMIFKKLGKKAGGKVALTLASKIASRAVPIAGLALLAYDAAMITKDMVENDTEFGSAVSKQLLGFDIFSDTEPALDEDGKPIQPDEEYNSDDLAKSQGIDKEKDFSNKESTEASENKEPGFFSKLTDSVTNGAKSAYESGKGYLSSAYEGVKKGVTTAIDYGKQALGGLVGSIPFPTGNGSWAALKDTIVGAAKAVGVDEKLMGVMGAIESGFNYTVKAGTSTATGLYQFLKSTWDSMVGKYGSKYGITKDTPPTEPRANALMGAEYLKENMSSLKSSVTGRDVNYTDAYMAHFLGIGGAKKFISAMEKDPGQSAPDLFQAPAAANKNIFYVGGDTSKPRTLGDVYNSFTNKINEKSKSFGIGDLGGSAPGPVPTSTTTTDKSSTGASSIAPTSNTNSSSSTSPSVPTSQPTTTSGSSNVPSSTPTPPPVVQQQQQTVSKPENDNAKVLAEGNSLLNSISSTLASSLEVQKQMATSLDNLSKLMSNNKTLDKSVEDLAKGVAPTFKSKPTGNSNDMPDVAVSLNKKNY